MNEQNRIRAYICSSSFALYRGLHISQYSNSMASTGIYRLQSSFISQRLFISSSFRCRRSTRSVGWSCIVSYSNFSTQLSEQVSCIYSLLDSFRYSSYVRSIYLAFMVRRLLTVAENLTIVDDKVEENNYV